jgi:hypothetical protein
VNTIPKNGVDLLRKPIPNFLPEELINDFLNTDLTFEYFSLKIAQVETAKRDSIPPTTVRSWFIEAVNRSWDKRILDQRCRAVLSKKYFGAVQFDDLLEAEETYTYEEIRIEAERLINYRINEVKYFEHMPNALTEDQLKSVLLMAWREVQTEMRLNQSRLIDEAKENEKEKFRMQLKEKKVRLNKMSLPERIKIVSVLEERKIIQPGFESNVVLHNLGDYCNLVPDELVHASAALNDKEKTYSFSSVGS